LSARVFWFRARWARDVAIPEINRLADQEQFVTALTLVQEAEQYLAGDPALPSIVSPSAARGI
jgi:hypothetical protein